MWMMTMVAAALQAAMALPAQAGSRGHTAVFVEAGASGLFERPAYATFRDGEFQPTDQAQACWQRRATGGERFGLIVRKVLPKGWEAGLAQALWDGQAGAAEQVRRVLSRQRASDGTAYDGAIVWHMAQGQVSLLALGARLPGKGRGQAQAQVVMARSKPFAWDDQQPQATAQALDQALCEVAAPLGVGFQP